MTQAPAKRSKRSPVSRDEGERRLMDATIDLARERPFGELSAREIARRADINHGYVHVWFGSKAGLIDAAYQRQAERLRTSWLEGQVTLTVDAINDPEVELLFRLLGRLQTEPDGVELAARRERPLLELIAHQLHVGAGVPADDARVVASLAVAAAAGLATVGRVLQLDVEALVAAWPRVLAGFRS